MHARFLPVVLALVLTTAAPSASRATSPRAATPPAPAACAALAQTLSEATGIAVTTAVGPARTVDERAPRGEGCLVTGTATGLTRRFGEVSDRLAVALRGWRHDVPFDADGPMSLVRRYARDGVSIIVFLETENPPGTCADIPIGDCLVPLRRWTWTLKAVAWR